MALCFCIVLLVPIVLLAQTNFEANALLNFSVPEFTVKWITQYSDTPAIPATPTTTSVDPFTGKNVTHPGSPGSPASHREWKTFDFRIKNQGVPVDDSGELGRQYYFYNIRYKGHFGENWTELYNANTRYLAPASSGDTIPFNLESEHTFHGIVDFQVELINGHFTFHDFGPGLYDWYLSFDADWKSGWSETQTINFDITPPTITVLSPKQQNYSNSDVSLNFLVNEEFNQLMYSLDGGQNVTISGNTTLAGLSNGSHNVTIYALDQAGNVGTSEAIAFTVESSFPTTIMLVIIAAITIAAALIIIRKKYHH